MAFRPGTQVAVAALATVLAGVEKIAAPGVRKALGALKAAIWIFRAGQQLAWELQMLGR